MNPFTLKEYIKKADSGNYFPGWIPILKKLEDRIGHIPDLEFAQIKEKFGRLRIYVNGFSILTREQIDLVNNCISDAEAESGETCMVCGKPASVKNRDSGWLVAACDEHVEARPWLDE